MKRDMIRQARRTSARRGVTLVEMLVTLAILLLMMTIIVQIFQAATGSLSWAQAYQELDNQLRQLDVDDPRRPPRGDRPLHPAARPQGQPRLLRVRRERLRRPPGRGHRRLPPVHRQGPDGKPFVGPVSGPPTAIANDAGRTTAARSRSRSPASTPRSSTSSATATSTAASS